MQDTDIARGLERQERLLNAILASLAPPETEEGSGFDDLVEALAELTVAVGDVTQAVRALRSDGCVHCPRSGAPSSGGG